MPPLQSRLSALDADWHVPTENTTTGITDVWVQSFVAQRIADVLARVAIGDRLHQLPPIDRAFLNLLAEDCVHCAVLRYRRFTETDET